MMVNGYDGLCGWHLPYLGVLGCAGLAEGVEKCCDGGDGGLADGVLPNCSLWLYWLHQGHFIAKNQLQKISTLTETKKEGPKPNSEHFTYIFKKKPNSRRTLFLTNFSL